MYFVYILVGIIGGLLGGMGMGGGTLLIPMLSICLDVPQRTAQLINLVSFIPMSVIALIIHIKNKFVVWNGVPFLIIPAVITAAISAIFATKVETEVLRQAFGVFLIVLGVAYLFIPPLVKKFKAKK